MIHFQVKKSKVSKIIEESGKAYAYACLKCTQTHTHVIVNISVERMARKQGWEENFPFH